jgi:hypothetical protein
VKKSSYAYVGDWKAKEYPGEVSYVRRESAGMLFTSFGQAQYWFPPFEAVRKRD